MHRAFRQLQVAVRRLRLQVEFIGMQRIVDDAHMLDRRILAYLGMGDRDEPHNPIAALVGVRRVGMRAEPVIVVEEARGGQRLRQRGNLAEGLLVAADDHGVGAFAHDRLVKCAVVRILAATRRPLWMVADAALNERHHLDWDARRILMNARVGGAIVHDLRS